MDGSTSKRTVAVVGTGLAGLATAFLLSSDRKRRYDVEVFETGSRASLDAASIYVLNHDQKQRERIDVPMRAFSEGYYPNLKLMYDYLGVAYQRQKMLFTFRTLDGAARMASNLQGLESQPVPSAYFVHASNNHIFPPARPQRASFFFYLFNLIWLGLWYSWFTVCCHRFPAYDEETIDDYFRRIRLSKAFIRLYILPLLSGICTCSHVELLNFPAKDLVDYRRQLIGGEQYTCANGVQEVQDKLLASLSKVTYNANVESVEPCQTRNTVTWRSLEGGLHARQFDYVVLATPPDVVSRIFRLPSHTLSRIPVQSISTITHSDRSRDMGWRCSSSSAQNIYLDTAEDMRATEATHVHDSGVMVTTSPLNPIDKSKIHGQHTFRRVLRTLESRRIVNAIMGECHERESLDNKWRNGESGVYLVGAWCWDGMVLLEGCVVSSLRVARALDIEVPWSH